MAMAIINSCLFPSQQKFAASFHIMIFLGEVGNLKLFVLFHKSTFTVCIITKRHQG